MEQSPKQKQSRVAYAVLTALVFVLGFVGGTSVAAGNGGNLFSGLFGPDSTPREDVDMSIFWSVWNTLEAKYVATATSTLPTIEERLYGAAEGLARSYGDPYTTFLPPAESQMFADDISGNFEGVGMEIGIRDGVLTVVAPLKGTPAERAGLLSGDKIIAIDGESTERLSTDQAVRKIRGERGTTVAFTILRDGSILDISVVRAVIEIPTLDATLRPDGVFVIELYNFSANASQLFRQAMQQFRASGANKLILDVRSNPGGFLDAAIDMASWFLPSGTVVVSEEYGEAGRSKVHRSRGYGTLPAGTKMVVLMNGGSASASEILAGALGDHGVATLVGERSFGKGSVQELIRMGNNTSLKVTIARWLTPNGISFSEGGLVPDVKVENDSDPTGWFCQC